MEEDSGLVLKSSGKIILSSKPFGLGSRSLKSSRLKLRDSSFYLVKKLGLKSDLRIIFASLGLSRLDIYSFSSACPRKKWARSTSKQKNLNKNFNSRSSPLFTHVVNQSYVIENPLRIKDHPV